jgi:hypothetical protein
LFGYRENPGKFEHLRHEKRSANSGTSLIFPSFLGDHAEKRERKKQWVRNRALIIIIWIISMGNFLLGCIGTNKILLGLWFFIYNILFLVL